MGRFHIKNILLGIGMGLVLTALTVLFILPEGNLK